jgi:hypothetical protein
MDRGRIGHTLGVKVHLWGELGFYGPGKRARFEILIDHEMPISDALRLIGVPEADVAVFGLNGVVVRLGDPAIIVTDDDRIDCFPPTSGG